jgi:hypothetical protein
MLLGTVFIISSTAYAASCVRFSGLACTAIHTMLAPRFKLLQPALGAGGAAQKGHFRVRHFDGFFVFTAEIANDFNTSSRELTRVLLGSRLVFVYVNNDLG